MNTRVFLLSFILIGILQLSAQEATVVGILPQLNINKELSPLFSLNFQIEGRDALYSKIGEDEKSGYEEILRDISVIGSRKVGLYNRFAMGYLIRIRDDQIIHRSIQQFSLIGNIRSVRVGHRIALDQSFNENTPPRYRLRYRFTPEIPLNGKKIDKDEFYLKVNNEYLNGLQDGDYELELRFEPLIGFLFTDKNKIEIGPALRFSSELKSSWDKGYWMRIGWFVKI